MLVNSIKPSINDFWEEAGFAPNSKQEEAILHTDGPLYLTAGPGSGKTRVLLWRTLNLIVYHDIKPDEIFLATFTEKAALQLRDGLRALLGMVTNKTDRSYDLGRMYIGTVHSLCQRMLADRKFALDRTRQSTIRLLDELSQYFYLMNGKNWESLVSDLAVMPEEAPAYINNLFTPGNQTPSQSKYVAVTNCISLFNRMAEEHLDPARALELWEGRKKKYSHPKLMREMIELYAKYGDMLRSNPSVEFTDFSLLQTRAYQLLEQNNQTEHIFKHVIVDEYQDTNAIQEMLFFKLAKGSGNICVVGDDDQALYRFRGATVENFVQFPERCQRSLGVMPHTIPLITNYRSRQEIVTFYNDFIGHCNWQESGISYRVNKKIVAQRQDNMPSVVASTAAKPVDVYPQIAEFVRQLIDAGKVQDPNQIAFLFPSLKSEHVRRAIEALEAVGLRAYAPRAGRFLEVEEAVDMFGVFVQVFGKPTKGGFSGIDYDNFFAWLDNIDQRGRELLRQDNEMRAYVEKRRAELQRAENDYRAFYRVVERNRWDLRAPYDIATMKRALYEAPGLSEHGKRAISNRSFENSLKGRAARGLPLLTLDYALKRATSIDWNVLDLFYRLSGFKHFKAMYDLAESGEDEGPICNLGLITQYLGRFMDEYLPLIPANMLADGRFVRLFFISYLYALYRRGESEYEDAEDPFPKGRIPFLTIHQSKGLEFPVVVLGNLRKDDKGLQIVEQLVRPLLDRPSEPDHRSSQFDIMRMFYVALSRAKNLLVLAHLKGQGQRINAEFNGLLANVTRIPDFDLASLPEAHEEDKTLPRSYSFTSDYLLYNKCARQYMVFKKYGFVASRSQTMFFGSLVHRTLEDLHNQLISHRENAQ
jgi:DNA helicase-2/ATP-dependent DNA helicase PcrA